MVLIPFFLWNRLLEIMHLHTHHQSSNSIFTLILLDISTHFPTLILPQSLGPWCRPCMFLTLWLIFSFSLSVSLLIYWSWMTYQLYTSKELLRLSNLSLLFVICGNWGPKSIDATTNTTKLISLNILTLHLSILHAFMLDHFLRTICPIFHSVFSLSLSVISAALMHQGSGDTDF
jgi:hypothetical protein